ncbi:unnamed protein product [Diatraea saccharalis]|uniref:Copper homeostasis protein cutC homolog n=1 Tax=Diatraea saccharalis TaxID=40085 RepID=A0A9N9RBN2_9NEOP|nr:unnamed protein product [Diatraea saccharalis]
MLEVCVDSLESALNAIHGGADELEICSSLTEGGLTPSAGLVKEISSVVNKIGTGSTIYKGCPTHCACQGLLKQPKLNVMIRCRTGSDFCYTDQEMDTMLADVVILKQMNVDRFVFGALTNIQNIDEVKCADIITKANKIPVTFHRAFDVSRDPIVSINKVIQLGFDRILTSGQRDFADNDEAIVLIRNLQNSFGDQIDIMPGAGVNCGNARLFIDLGCKIVHSSCKGTRILPKMNNHLNMGTGDSEHLYITDVNIVKKMKEILQQIK